MCRNGHWRAGFHDRAAEAPESPSACERTRPWPPGRQTVAAGAHDPHRNREQPQAARAFGPEAGERVDETGDRRIGSHRAGHARLGPQHADVGQAVSAERYGQGRVQQDLARIVHRPLLAPRRESRRYRGSGPDLRTASTSSADPACEASAAAAPNADTRVRPVTLLHLESASSLASDGTLDCARPVSPSQGHPGNGKVCEQGLTWIIMPRSQTHTRV
jgi:hypothetical protein